MAVVNTPLRKLLIRTRWRRSDSFTPINKTPEEDPRVFCLSEQCRLSVLLDESGDVAFGAGTDHFVDHFTVLKEEEGGNRGDAELGG